MNNEEILNDIIENINSKINDVNKSIKRINKANKGLFNFFKISTLLFLVAFLGYHLINPEPFSKLISISLIPTFLSCSLVVPNFIAKAIIERKKEQLINENLQNKIELQKIKKKELSKTLKSESKINNYTKYLEHNDYKEPLKRKNKIKVYERK